MCLETIKSVWCKGYRNILIVQKCIKQYHLIRFSRKIKELTVLVKNDAIKNNFN